jgi:signal peptidase I
MSTPAQAAGQPAEPSAPQTPADQSAIPASAATTPAPHLSRFAYIRLHLPTVSEAFTSLLRTIVVALFLLTFLLQPFLIPSESMERTLLVGDFLLVNKQIFAPDGGNHSLARLLMPYRDVERGDIVLFHHPEPHPFLIKRVIGLPGDRIRIDDGRVSVNGRVLNEPYAAYEPVFANSIPDNFPSRLPNPNIRFEWWRQMQKLTQNDELVVPAGMYFMLGDNRNHSDDSRFWGLVPRQAIVARPIVIYFSLTRPSATDVEQASDDRLNHDRELSARLTGFARWKRIFRVVH